MGMFYCDECKSERLNSVCNVCGKQARKYWWTFGPDDKHKTSYKVYYKPDGSVDRETSISG